IGEAPFVGYSRTLQLSLVDLDPNADPNGGACEVSLVRGDGKTTRYAARPFPVPPAIGDLGTSPDMMLDPQTVFLAPEDLASMAGAPSAPDLEGGDVITFERVAGTPGEALAAPASKLADLVTGAVKLHARRLIVVRADESRSIYEPWLSLPGALPMPSDTA